ncbi:MAG TPA: hypothetical protein PLR73_10930 [Acetivibrio sp.]|nr:hypothetical protein [Acetivibrio sp.]
MILKKTAFMFSITAILLFTFAACQSDNTKDNVVPTANDQTSGSTSYSDTIQSQKNSDSKENPPNVSENKATSVNYIEKLKSENVDTKEIESAELYVKRVTLQLNEIQTFSNNAGFLPSAADPVLYNPNTDDTLKYSELSSKIDEKKAIYYMIKLKDIFGTKEKVFDEYLISLQLDIDLGMCITDRDSYEQLRKEKLAGIVESDLITAEKIDEKAYKSLQRLNDINKNNYPNIGNDPYNPFDNTVPTIINPQQPNIPKVEIPRPVDPAEEINRKLSPNG